ncbi:MAG: 2-oxoacid:ferredoxin oxidoreductase subunit beta [Phycisphaerae bacterium]|nr:2-oxoacid:ferredoxin oxidoreductase subunit beta [Phycisphaerae bacterium]|tara:strand:- start:3122 stop:4138 length:1017 start_codon:yes stop_codon:yes gene_type:complete
MNEVALPTYKPKDFASDQDVRWCPGCGDYAVLTAMKKMAANLGAKKEDFVFVSGIGCAARFPYYMDTYGAHTVHGRSPAFATGVKIANPDLEVFLISGDGDLLSIGGNHTMHALRRNIDINIVLLNNKIYGLTKGQYSPTSEVGKITKSTPFGSLDEPINPITLALASGGSFVARSLDVDVKGLTTLIDRGAKHKGTSFIEVYQDCNVFNHQAWFYATQKDTRPENTILLEHGKPLIFGAESDKGIRRNGDAVEIVTLGDEFSEADLLVHDESNLAQAFLLSQLYCPEFPEPIGVFYVDESRPSYDEQLHSQVNAVVEKNGKADLQAIITGANTWSVE